MTPDIKACVRTFSGDPTAFTWVDLTDAYMYRPGDYRDRAVAMGVFGPFDYADIPLPFESCAIVFRREGGAYVHTVSRKEKSLVITFNLDSGQQIFGSEIEFEISDSGRKYWLDPAYESQIMQAAKPGESVVDVLAAIEQDTIRDLLYATAGFYGPVSVANPIKRKPAKGSGACKPMYDWHTVVLEPPKPKQEPQGGHHASPRAHDRRGHFKNYKSGKRVWFAACTVNKSKPGFIFKDYTTRS